MVVGKYVINPAVARMTDFTSRSGVLALRLFGYCIFRSSSVADHFRNKLTWRTYLTGAADCGQGAKERHI